MKLNFKWEAILFVNSDLKVIWSVNSNLGWKKISLKVLFILPDFDSRNAHKSGIIEGMTNNFQYLVITD